MEVDTRRYKDLNTNWLQEDNLGFCKGIGGSLQPDSKAVLQ